MFLIICVAFVEIKVEREKLTRKHQGKQERLRSLKVQSGKLTPKGPSLGDILEFGLVPVISVLNETF